MHGKNTTAIYDMNKMSLVYFFVGSSQRRI